MNFLTELIKRFLSDTPWFFKIVRVLSFVVAIVTGIPEVIESVCQSMEVCITLPDAWSAISSKVISIAAVVSSFIAQLTVTTDQKKAKNLKD